MKITSAPMLRFNASAVSVLVLAVAISASAAADWQPATQVELIVPAGPSGGADQMARYLQGIVAKHGLMAQPLLVVNKTGGAGADGFLAVKEATGNPHKLIITLSNLFTAPLAQGAPFNWNDLTPVAMLALDQFVLWVNAESPYSTAGEYLAAAKAAGANRFRMGGTGSKQEDQIITVAMERAAGVKFKFQSFKSGGDVALQLAGKHIESSVNNPIEAVTRWRAGKLRPLCVFDNVRMQYKKRITETQSWYDIPTCREAGIPFDYVMLRGIFMPGGVSQEQVGYYVNLLRKVRAPAEWIRFMEDGAFKQTFMAGAEYTAWLEKAEATHVDLMREAGFLARP